MKKSAVFLILSFVLLGFFACQLAIPTAIEIIGTPSARFAETVDVGKMFTDLLKDAISEDDRLTIIPCPATPEIITYLIHADLFKDEFDDLKDKNDIKDIFPDTTLIPDDHIDVDIPLENNETLILFDSEREEDAEKSLIVPLSELSSFLPGFEFYNGKIKKEGVDDEYEDDEDQKGVYKTILYFSGSEIINKSKIKIIIKEIEGMDEYEKPIIAVDPIYIKDDIEPINHQSEIDDWIAKGYDKDTCPIDGIPIEIPITGKDISIWFEVYIPEHTELKVTDFRAGYINVEVVVWLPFKFIAVEENAALSFPEGSFFSAEDDLFGRKEPDSESLIFDIIESLSVDVIFYNNPFKGAELIISNKKDIDAEEDKKGINIPTNRIADDSLSFTLTEENMKEINNPDNWPFIPDIKIGFTKGEKLSFPKEFNVIEFAFKAKARYRIDL
jgi:hypothetical protein